MSLVVINQQMSSTVHFSSDLKKHLKEGSGRLSSLPSFLKALFVNFGTGTARLHVPAETFAGSRPRKELLRLILAVDINCELTWNDDCVLPAPEIHYGGS